MSHQLFLLLAEATLDTLYMVALSGAIGTALGLPLGVWPPRCSTASAGCW